MKNSQLFSLIAAIWLGLSFLDTPVGLGIGAAVFFVFAFFAASLERYRASVRRPDSRDKP